jgi:uncharacterized protein
LNEELKLLIELQRITTALKEALEEHDQIPKTIARIESRLQGIVASFEQHKKELEDAEKLRRAKERAITDNEAKLKSQSARQFNVKTNKEFEAIKQEVAFLQETNHNLEDDVLELIERIDELKAAIAEEEKLVEKEEKSIQGDRTRHLKQQEKLKTKIKKLQKEAKKAEARLSDGQVKMFYRIATRRDGLAVVPCQDGVCSGCHMRSRLQIWAEIARNDRIYQCFNCQRILYKEPEPVEKISE